MKAFNRLSSPSLVLMIIQRSRILLNWTSYRQLLAMSLARNLALLIVLLLRLIGNRAVTRVYFSKCGLKGFSCSNNNNQKIEITYECPPGINEPALFVNQFQAPTNIESLKIKNCQSMIISTRCSGENRFIQKLEVTNVTKLTLQRLQFTPMLPPIVMFENISSIDKIPSFTFMQIEKAYHSTGCYIPQVDFHSIYLKNVSIGVVQPNAFVATNNFSNFSLIDVHIQRIQTSGIQVRMDLKGGFEMRRCFLGHVEPLGMQLFGKRAVFSENHFEEISFSGINATLEDFYFTKNFIAVFESQGFSVLATNMFILDNNFLLLKSGAMERLSPGLIQDSGRNFGKLKFRYDFSKNTLNYLEVDSLHPDVLSYDNVPTEMMFSRNIFNCTCENIGWLFSYNNPKLEPFYEMVLDGEYANVCDNTAERGCHLLLKRLKGVVQCGKCSHNFTLERLCRSESVANVTMRYENITEDVPEEMLVPGNEIVIAGTAAARSCGALLIVSMLNLY
ncbi:uncharacterized protein [Euwallacea fornicatus]|uniref:uncharacterized protein n=1 Tax=Euwallacea fornicatus TaxID=995702 RepID=UPI0033903C8F